MIAVLLSITFGCGVFIAIAHVINNKFIAPVYDVIANLVAFLCAIASSLLLEEPIPAIFASLAVACWILLAIRTVRHRNLDSE